MFLYTILTFLAFILAPGSDGAEPSYANAECDPVAGPTCVTDLLPQLDTEAVWQKIGTGIEHTRNFNACLEGEQLACTIVGGELMSGRDLPRDLALSMGLLGPACDAGVGAACLGVAAYWSEHPAEAPDPDLVIDLYARACAWDLDACQSYATLYLDGKLVPPDYEKAEFILNRACARGSAASCYGYALLYYEGEGVPKDLPLAVDMLERACALNSPDGCWLLGLLTEWGTGEADPARAVELLDKSCDLALGKGCYEAGQIRINKINPQIADYDAALMRLISGCRLGHGGSCAQAGYLHSERLVSSPSEVMSFEFAQLGCDLDDPTACSNLGLKYEYGRGVEVNGPLADQAYRHACQLGNSGGCNGLGNIYAKGMAGTQDDRRAVELFEQACEMGDEVGCANVALFGEQLRGGYLNRAKILAYYKRSCDGGFEIACDKVSKMEAER